ncbi:hypothetical protein Tco_1563298 [Tanacetum coccineum]
MPTRDGRQYLMSTSRGSVFTIQDGSRIRSPLRSYVEHGLYAGKSGSSARTKEESRLLEKAEITIPKRSSLEVRATSDLPEGLAGAYFCNKKGCPGPLSPRYCFSTEEEGI